jgi:uncharacterized protein (DUF2141 family)
MRPALARPLAFAGLLCLAALPASALAQAPFGPTIMGKIVWPGHDLSQGQVRVYRDQALSELVDQFGTGGAGGTFVVLVDPGEYYLMAVVDGNGNGKVDQGDGLGFYGVAKFGAEGQEPALLKVGKDALIGDVRIPITAAIGETGKPEAIEAPSPVETTPTGIPASVGGMLTNVEQLEVPAFLMVLTADAHRPVATVRVTADEPDFHFSASPGDYHLIAVADVSGERRLGARDRVGAYGVPDWSEPPTELPPLTLTAGDEIGGVQIAMAGHLGEDGVVRSLGGAGSFQLDASTLPAIISGAVIHRGAGLKPAQVRLSADPGMSQPIAAVECEPGPGTFVTHVNPGTYYVTAVVDENNDGRFGPGDAVGFYGIDDITAAEAPPPVTVENGSLVGDLNIRIAARITEDMKLAPIAPGEDEATEETED